MKLYLPLSLLLLASVAEAQVKSTSGGVGSGKEPETTDPVPPEDLPKDFTSIIALEKNIIKSFSSHMKSCTGKPLNELKSIGDLALFTDLAYATENLGRIVTNGKANICKDTVEQSKTTKCLNSLPDGLKESMREFTLDDQSLVYLEGYGLQGHKAAEKIIDTVIRLSKNE